MSKYDNYWLKILDKIERLIEEAYNHHKSHEIDVSDLAKHGNRKSWYGTITISREGIHRGAAAHVKSLGKIILNQGLLSRYSTAFKIKVTKNLKLTVTLSREPASKLPENAYADEDTYIAIHKLLEKLPIHKHPINWQNIPNNGIYFFYEENETLQIKDKTTPRIVRVGTHEKPNRLPERIRNHYHGNRKNSIFRKHLGAAIMAKEKDPRLNLWLNEKNKAPLSDVEEKVSNILHEKFSFRYIQVDDENERLELEERLIATLAKFSPKRISPNWLGLHSPYKEVRKSGLWNIKHINSRRYLGPTHLARLDQLVHKTLTLYARNKKALILIPCSKSKNQPKRSIPASSEKPATCTKTQSRTPLPHLTEPRNKLLKLVKETPHLRERPENQRGVLNPSAPPARAIDLYTGHLHRKVEKALRDILKGKYPYIHVLIVSALYGLVKLDEKIREYNLSMNDKLANGAKVYQFWQQEQLWKILQNYIQENKITHIWSLLPTKYHKVFKELWANLKNKPTKCIHIKPSKAGSATPTKRGQWLNHIIENDPLHLISQQPLPPNQAASLTMLFQYIPC